jgi:hypothetical protein
VISEIYSVGPLVAGSGMKRHGVELHQLNVFVLTDVSDAMPPVGAAG